MKYAHFIPLPSHYSAATLAPIFLAKIYHLHGMPKTTISDRDRVFISKFCHELFHLHDTTLSFRTIYHPQLSCQTEVTNKILETFLHWFISNTLQRWVSFITLVEHWYNTLFQSAFHMLPFKSLCGRAPLNLWAFILGSTIAASLKESLAQHCQMLQLIKCNFVATQLCMRSMASVHPKTIFFAIGECV